MAIRTFKDLEIYQESYKMMLVVFNELLPKLPKEERWDLVNQLSRSTKAVPRLIAEGYAKKENAKVFKKYLRDALGENNETIVGLFQCRDLYPAYIEKSFIEQLVRVYTKISKQIYTLEKNWKSFN